MNMKEFKLCAFADEAGSAISDQVDALRGNEVPFLEVRGVDGKNISDLSVDDAKNLVKRLDDAGVRVWSIGSPLGKIKITDDFVPHLEKFRRVLEVAQTVKASAIRLFSFYLPEGSDPEDYREEVLARLGAFCDAAKGSGVTLCHENEKGIYGDVATRCLTIQKALPELRAVFDPANFIQSGERDIPAAFDMLAPYIYYFHVKDSLPNGSVVPAGHGCACFPVLLHRYGQLEHASGVLTLEPHLNNFVGLSDLEESGARSNVGLYRYPSQRAAFDAAVAALRKLI